MFFLWCFFGTCCCAGLGGGGCLMVGVGCTRCRGCFRCACGSCWLRLCMLCRSRFHRFFFHRRGGRSWERFCSAARCLGEETKGEESQSQGECYFFHDVENEKFRKRIFFVCATKVGQHSTWRKGIAGQPGRRQGEPDKGAVRNFYRPSNQSRNSLALALLTMTGSLVAVFNFSSSLRAK